MEHAPDHLYMQRAMDLARLGAGYVSPNPMVGCVIVHNNQIIGEGWHRQYGEPHAEVNAIRDVEDQHLLEQSTLYVNLEPCFHYGNTPPCTNLIVEKNIPGVVIANRDPNPQTAGQGIEKLRNNGVEVATGIMEAQGRLLNRRFFHFFESHTPYIILKWAETADGFVADTQYNSKWISNALARKLVHKWRHEEDAILVGTRTAWYDNPQLTVRDWHGKNPVRLVIDPENQLPGSLKLFDGEAPARCYNPHKDQQEGHTAFIKTDFDNLIAAITEDLYQHKIQSLLVEGGSTLLQQFIDAGCWNEIRKFTGDQQYRDGIKAPSFTGVRKEMHSLFNNILEIYTRP